MLGSTRGWWSLRVGSEVARLVSSEDSGRCVWAAGVVADLLLLSAKLCSPLASALGLWANPLAANPLAPGALASKGELGLRQQK